MAKPKKKRKLPIASEPAETQPEYKGVLTTEPESLAAAVLSSETVAGAEPATCACPFAAAAGGERPSAGALISAEGTPTVIAQGRWHRWLPDLFKVALALAVIVVAAAIWYKPPLIRSDFPYVSYRFNGQRASDAVIYRPLAMPTRYYIAMPRLLAGRYEWFAVDRRREVVALTEAPRHRFFGKHAVKRSDPLGLDLEFRKLDGSEWQIHFLEDSIVFSNALLSVRMDTNRHEAR